jgi:energy-coupling factor transport system permease protein
LFTPERKILLYIVFVVVLFISTDPLLYSAFVLILLFLLLRLPKKLLTRGLVPVSLILFASFAGSAFLENGKVIAGRGMFMLTEEGLYEGVIRTVRVFLMIAGAKVLMGTTGPKAAAQALERPAAFFNRLGLPAVEFARTIGMTIEVLPKLKERILSIYACIREERARDGFGGRVMLFSSLLSGLIVQSLSSPERFFEEREVEVSRDDPGD